MKLRSIGNKIPEIRIDITAYNKIMEATNICNNEIALLGCVKKENNSYLIYDAIIIEQEVHSTTAEITEEGLSKLALELVEKENGVQMWNDIKMWYHSHVNMSTSPSIQDEEQMKLFIQNNDDFFIRMIGNKKEELKIDLYNIENGIVYEDLHFKMEYEENTYNKILSLNNQINFLKGKLEELIAISPTLKTQVAKEIKEKVKEKTFKTYPTYNNSYGYKNGYNDYGYNAYDWNSKKNEIKSETRRNVSEIFEELSETDVFEMMYAIEYLNGIDDVIDVSVSNQLTVRDIIELEDMVSEYCAVYKDKYEEYLLGN